MFSLAEWLKNHLNSQWYNIIFILALPLIWIFPVQNFLIPYVWGNGALIANISKRIFLLLPAMLFIVGCWCSMLSVYLLAFRRSPTLFIQIVFLTWWDSGRAICMFWAGIFHFLLLLLAYLWQLLRMIVSSLFVIIKQLILFPFNFIISAGNKYFEPGVPWIAVILTVIWVGLEASIFTYVMLPTVSEVISDVVGFENHRFLTPFLFVFLYLIVAGSFACIQVLKESVESRKISDMIQMFVMEGFVMFLEVVFLYRELIDTISPWIYQQTGHQLGLAATLALGSFGWIGISLMNWFLFGRYGTPTLLAIISRKPIDSIISTNNQEKAKSPTESLFFTSQQMEMFKREGNWFSEKGYALMEALTLPPLQICGAIINFFMVLVSGRPLFNLPFKNLKDAYDTQQLLTMLENKKEATMSSQFKKAQREKEILEAKQEL
ncbi:MAG: hypothetical protein ACMUJM_12945 [bacterium]